jgi:hypothetical protein
VVEEGGTELLQLVLLQVCELDVAISDVIKIQFVGRVGARQATGHRESERRDVSPDDLPKAVAHVDHFSNGPRMASILGILGFPATADTMDTVSRPAGGHNSAAEGNHGKVSQEGKKRRFLFLSVTSSSGTRVGQHIVLCNCIWTTPLVLL